MARIDFGEHHEIIDANNIILSRYIQVPVEDSMKFTFNFMYEGDWRKQKVDLTDIDIRFEFFCKDAPDKKYLASKVGQEYTNCILYEDTSALRVIMSDHGLEPGYLMCRVIISYPDVEFNNGTAKVVRVADFKIALVDDLTGECKHNLDAAREDRFGMTIEIPMVAGGGGKKKFTVLYGSINSVGFKPDDAEKFAQVFTHEEVMYADSKELTSIIFAGTYGNGIALPSGFEAVPKSAIKFGMFDVLSAYVHTELEVDGITYNIYWNEQLNEVVADQDEEIKWNF